MIGKRANILLLLLQQAAMNTEALLTAQNQQKAQTMATPMKKITLLRSQLTSAATTKGARQYPRMEIIMKMDPSEPTR